MGVSKIRLRRSNVKNKVESKMMVKIQRCTGGQYNKHLDLRGIVGGKWGVDKDYGLSADRCAATNTFFTKWARSHEARHDDTGAQPY